MPARPLRPCAAPLCPTLVRGGRCLAHASEPWAGRAHWRERYGNDWPRLRRAILERDSGICVDCGRIGTTVDHRTPLAEGGTHDHENLVTLCRDCQQSKAGKEGARGLARRRAIRAHIHPVRP